MPQRLCVWPLLPTSFLPRPKLSVQQPGAVLAHGHSGFVVLFFLALLQLCSATPESKAWPSKFRCITTGCPGCLHSPLCPGQHLPPTLCPRDWPSVLPPFSLHLGLALRMGWEAWERLGDGGRE